MKFKKGEKAFFMWVGHPEEVKITATWGEDRYKFKFIGKSGNSGWTLRESEIFATLDELMESNIKTIDKKVEELKKEREHWCSYLKPKLDEEVRE